MDSLTQITLGAAVGEVVLGKRAGNRAMVWGAVAGTFPDLDILANFVTDPVSSLAYHRAFTHSLVFATVIPLGLGLLVHRLYGGREGPWPQDSKWSLLTGWLFFFMTVFIGSTLMPLEIYNTGAIALVVSAAMIAAPLVFQLRESRRTVPSSNENPGWQAWTLLFFLGIVTHPLLDACTTYGTQLFEPFSSLRVAWNVVSVADPVYTLPFLICLILAGRSLRGSVRRKRLNWAGIIISSAYLLLCTGFHAYAKERMAATLERDGIVATRHIVGPTILNSVLWQGTAETDKAFYTGQYSFFDEEPFFKLRSIPKNHELVEPYWNDRDVRTLRWFADGYFGVEQEENGNFRMNDLRYGRVDFPDKRPMYIFFFELAEQDGVLKAVRVQQGPEDRQESFGNLWGRMMGRE